MNPENTASREIRVFLSSTFTDMQAERDYLVKKIFPAIQLEARRRNVNFTVLDLRWGITEEEAKSGKVIEICMDEISRTRPFFIGLIGGRYGWVPTEADNNFDERLYNRFPHVREGLAQGKSITEMEMLYGVLAYPEQTYSHFFIKSLRAVPKKFLDKKGSENALKREKLKDAVREAAAAGKCSVSDYSSLKQLGAMVSEALMRTLDSLYPADVEMSKMDLIMSNHDADILRLRKIYVPPTTSLSDDFIDEDDKVGVLVSPSGTGKSAWAANYWNKEVVVSPGGKKYIAVHTMIGREINSAEMCRRALAYDLCRTFSELEKPDLNIPNDQRVDISSILGWLEEHDISLLWILDGVDRLQNRTERFLVWVNDIIDEERKVMLLGTDESQLNEFTSSRLKSTNICIFPLSETQKMLLTSAYLREFAKGLTVSQRAGIANDPELGAPGVLRIFLNELLQYGVYENLDDFMARYIDAPDMESFLDVVLQRVDGDFDPKIISDFLNTLRLSFYGLNEDDVVDFLKIKPVEWAAVFNALEEFIEVSGGRMKLKSGYFTEVVASHYPINDSEEKRLRNAILRYAKKRFKNQLRQAIKAADADWMELFFQRLTGIFYTIGSYIPEISVYYAESVRQIIALKRFRNIISWLGLEMCGYGDAYKQDIFGDLHILKENNVSLFRVVSIKFLILSLISDDNFALVYYKMLIGGFGTERDVKSVNNLIKFLPVPTRFKKKMLDFWNDAEETTAFIDSWDENNFGDSMNGLLVRNSELLIIFDIDLIEKIHQKLLRTVANLPEKELEEMYGGLLYCNLAMTSARLEKFEEAEHYIRLSRGCGNIPIGYAEISKLYADCLNPRMGKDERARDFEKFRKEFQGILPGKGYLEYLAEAIAFPEDYQRIKDNVAEAHMRMKSGDKFLGAAARNIGEILYAVKYWQGAMTAYEEYGSLVEENQNKAYASYHAGYSAFQFRAFDRAVEFLELNLKQIRTLPDVKNFDENVTLNYLYKSYLECGRVDEGIAAAEERIANRIREKVPKNYLSADYNSLAVALSNILGRYSSDEYVRLLDRIIAYYKLAVQYEPDDRVIRYNLLTTIFWKFDCGALTKSECIGNLRQLENLYQTNIKVNDAEQIRFCAGTLARAYYKLELWDKALEMIEKHDGKDFLAQYDFLRAKIMTGKPEQRQKVSDLIIKFMCVQDLTDRETYLASLKRQLNTICKYVADFGLDADIILNADQNVIEKEHFESFIVCNNYVAAVNGSEKLAELNRRMLADYMTIFSEGESKLRKLAKFLLLACEDTMTPEMIDAKFAELKQFFVLNVGSAEELKVREMENFDLYILRQDGVMKDFIKELAVNPLRNRVLIRIIDRLHDSDVIGMYFREYFEPLSQLLKKGMVNDSVLLKLDKVLDEVSSYEDGRDYSDLLYPMYVSAGLEPSAASVLFYMDHIEATEGIDAAVRFYDDTDAGNKYGLEYSLAIMLRCAGRMSESEAIVDRNLGEKSEYYKYWVFEKIRHYRSRGEFRQAAELFLAIPDEDIDQEFVINTNFWVIASVFTYAGMHEKALGYLEMSMNDGSDYDGAIREYDPENFGDTETGAPLTESELNFFFDVLLRSVIYFRMGNEKLGFEVFKTWEAVTEQLIERNEKEIALVSLRELELARLMLRKGNRQMADAHYRKACMLVDKAEVNSLCRIVKEQFDREFPQGLFNNSGS